MRDSEETVDESSIPLLDEVVDPQEITPRTSAQDEARQRGMNQKTLLEVLRDGITAQLNHDLRPIVATAVAIAVDQVTEQTRKLLQEELNGALEARLRQLIEEEVAREIKKGRS
jgi:hypothetical protein